MRRGVGVASIAQHKNSDEKFKDKKCAIDETSVEQLQVQLNKLKDKLEWFAAKHQNVLKTDPMFRQEFIQMCAAIGVDPLASCKGFWTEFLGVGTFYYQLAVQAIEIVLSGQAYHGGIIPLENLWKQLIDSRSGYLENSALSCYDVKKAFEILEVIGKSCGVIETEGNKMEQWLVYCVPEELSLDNTKVIQRVAESGKAYFVVSDLETGLGWPRLRIKGVVEQLLREGIIWLDLLGSSDDGNHLETLYWMPGLYFSNG